MYENPFTVITPERMKAEDAVKLFVDVFTDFPQVQRAGHVFLHGPRGSGKSMMFRYLKPDCQQLDLKSDVCDLPFFSFYVPIKNTALDITELRRLNDVHGAVVLNEHFLVAYIAQTIFSSFATTVKQSSLLNLDQTKHFTEHCFFKRLRMCGYTEDKSIPDLETASDYFNFIAGVCEEIFIQIHSYFKKLSTPFIHEPIPYEGPLCDYSDFLFPLFKNLRNLPCMPDGPIFLLIDDADNLSEIQTRVLNSWVASRTTSTVSLKVSTQLKYKTYHTISGRLISSPHDFSEVNISTIYTASSRRATYPERVEKIVSKRLKLADINMMPEQFFPPHPEQRQRIEQIAEEFRRNYDVGKGKGSKRGDDARRYARSEFMKSLAGESKSLPSYSYSGFDQLVHISSGVIRYFLDAAALMFSITETDPKTRPVKYIPPHIQDRVVRNQADIFLHGNLERMRQDQSPYAPDKQVLDELYNLIQALGGTFKQKLLSDDSERNVFSIAFSDRPSERVRRVFKLGKELGYFHVSAIGNKEGTGRTPLYVMTRMLSPYFSLDPTGFHGYLFVTNDAIERAIHNPDNLLRKIKTEGIESVFELRQLSLFNSE